MRRMRRPRRPRAARRSSVQPLLAAALVFSAAAFAAAAPAPAAVADGDSTAAGAATAVPAAVAGDSSGSAATPVLLDRIVAIVDEEAILQSDLERETELFRMERQYAGEPVPDDPAVVRREMLDRLVESKLIIAAAKQADMSVDPEAIQGSVDQKIQQFVEHFGSLEAFQRELARNGMTLEDYRARMSAQLRDQQYLRLVVGKFIRPEIEVLENEVRDYYRANLADMPAEPDSVTIADILVAVQPSRDARQRVQAKVAEIQAALRAGTAFADVARRYSEDAAAARGGVVGAVRREDLYDPALARAVFSLAVGAVSEPVVTGRGVHIVRLDAVQDDGRRAISQIFLPISVTDADVAAARAQADAARARVLGGESFALVAGEISADANSAQAGGVLGTFQLTDLSEAFQSALGEVPEGGLSEPVRTPAGWYVFKVLARRNGRTYTYEEVSEQLRQAVESQKIEAKLADYVKELRKRFFIDEKG